MDPAAGHWDGVYSTKDPTSVSWYQAVPTTSLDLITRHSAVLHFLTSAPDRSAYVRAASLAVERGGVIVVGVFAEDGPEQCSGLPTARYDAQSLTELFEENFDLVESLRDVHQTPWGAEQPFTWVVLRRRGPAD